MYFPYFITYIAVGFLLSLVVLFWALHSGQFREQQRARFLPLEADPETPPSASRGFPRVEVYGLFMLACAGLMASAAVVAFSLWKS